MKKKTKNKKGGYPHCSGHEDPDAFCRERAENGPTEEDEFTVCDTNTGNCVKPMGDVNRRRLRQQQQAIHQEEEEAEEQRINENLVNEFDEELFGDNADYGGGGRKIFRRKQKKKIGGYNSCLNFPNHDKYCRELSLTLSHLKGHTHCDTETGFCIKPLSDTERKKRNKQRTEALLKRLSEEREAKGEEEDDDDDDDDDIDMDDLFGSDSEDESNYKTTSKPVKLSRKKQSLGKSNLNGGKKKSRKKLRKKRKKTRRKHKRKSKSRKKRKSRKK